MYFSIFDNLAQRRWPSLSCAKVNYGYLLHEVALQVSSASLTSFHLTTGEIVFVQAELNFRKDVMIRYYTSVEDIQKRFQPTSAL